MLNFTHHGTTQLRCLKPVHEHLQYQTLSLQAVDKVFTSYCEEVAPHAPWTLNTKYSVKFPTDYEQQHVQTVKICTSKLVRPSLINLMQLSSNYLQYPGPIPYRIWSISNIKQIAKRGSQPWTDV